MMLVNVLNRLPSCAVADKYFSITVLLYVVFIMNMQFTDICILILQ